MSDIPDGHGSGTAPDADATGNVSRHTKSQTTAASYTITDHDVIGSSRDSADT